MIDDTQKIGPTIYSTEVRDNPQMRALEINVKERTWGTVHWSRRTWPYEDKRALFSQLNGFISRKPEPIKGEWFARFALWLTRRPLVGHLGTITEIKDQKPEDGCIYSGMQR